MRKILILVTVMVMTLIMAGCTGGGDLLTPPSYTTMTVNGFAPMEGGSFVTFFKGKDETVEVAITLNNPDNVNIKSIVILDIPNIFY